MKHSIAISCAGIGMGIAILIDASVVSIICGLGFGAFIGYFIAGLTTAKENLLKEGFGKLGNLPGKTLDEIVAVVGPYKSCESCVITDRDNAPGFYYTWHERAYLVVLLFDADNICIGLSKEIDSGQVLH